MKYVFDLTHVFPSKDSTEPFDISKYIDGYNTVYFNKEEVLAYQNKREGNYYISPTAFKQTRVYNDFDKKKHKYHVVVETPHEYKDIRLFARFDTEGDYGTIMNASYASFGRFVQELFCVPEYNENWKSFKKLKPIWS